MQGDNSQNKSTFQKAETSELTPRSWWDLGRKLFLCLNVEQGPCCISLSYLNITFFLNSVLFCWFNSILSNSASCMSFNDPCAAKGLIYMTNHTTSSKLGFGIVIFFFISIGFNLSLFAQWGQGVLCRIHIISFIQWRLPSEAFPVFF